MNSRFPVSRSPASRQHVAFMETVGYVEFELTTNIDVEDGEKNYPAYFTLSGDIEVTAERASVATVEFPVSMDENFVIGYSDIHLDVDTTGMELVYDSKNDETNQESIIGGDKVCAAKFTPTENVNQVQIFVRVRQLHNASHPLQISIREEAHNGLPGQYLFYENKISINNIPVSSIGLAHTNVSILMNVPLNANQNYFLVLSSSEGSSQSYAWEGLHHGIYGNRYYSINNENTWVPSISIKKWFYIKGKYQLPEDYEPFYYYDEDLMTVSRYFPERYRNSEDYQVFIKMLAMIFSKVRPYIENFNDLVDIDRCPIQFLPLLGRLVDYEYDYNKSARSQRLIIKYIMEAYRKRGTETSMDIVLKLASIDEPVEDVIPGTEYDDYIFNPTVNVDENEITMPRELMFRHNISKWSGTHAYADMLYYRDTVFDIFAPEVTEMLRYLMTWVIPAGSRTYWTMTYYLGKMTEYGDVFRVYCDEFELEITGTVVPLTAGLIWSTYTHQEFRSWGGRHLAQVYLEIIDKKAEVDFVLNTEIETNRERTNDAEVIFEIEDISEFHYSKSID